MSCYSQTPESNNFVFMKTARKIYFAEYIVQGAFYGNVSDKQEILASLYFKMCGESLNLVWFSNFSDKGLSSKS